MTDSEQGREPVFDDAVGYYDDAEDAWGGDAPRRRSLFSRIPWGRVGLLLVLAFFVAAVALFVWNRWYRFDDAADIQGTWRDEATGSILELDGENMRIARDVVYSYTLNTAEKTISYRLGDDTGFSSYRFSEDRKHLVLEDGVGTDWGLVFHFRDDPGFSDAALPDGMTRLEKASDEVPAIALPGSLRPQQPISSVTSGVGVTSSDADASSSDVASASSDTTAPEPVEWGDGKFIGPGYGDSSSSSEDVSSDDAGQSDSDGSESDETSDSTDSEGAYDSDSGSNGSDSYDSDATYDSYSEAETDEDY